MINTTQRVVIDGIVLRSSKDLATIRSTQNGDETTLVGMVDAHDSRYLAIRQESQWANVDTSYHLVEVSTLGELAPAWTHDYALDYLDGV